MISPIHVWRGSFIDHVTHTHGWDTCKVYYAYYGTVALMTIERKYMTALYCSKKYTNDSRFSYLVLLNHMYIGKQEKCCCCCWCGVVPFIFGVTGPKTGRPFLNLKYRFFYFVAWECPYKLLHFIFLMQWNTFFCQIVFDISIFFSLVLTRNSKTC